MAGRIYTDTSVIGGCEDDEFRGHSRRLMDAFVRGELRLVLSELTLRELAPALLAVREVHGCHAVNAWFGHPTIEIRSPREVLADE